MVALNLKVRNNGREQTVKGTCPVCWEELKTRQYIRILREWEDGTDIVDRDYFKLFDILTDGKFTGFEKTTDADVTIINLVGWVIATPLAFDKTLPKVLRFKGKNIDIPQNPRELSIGQNIVLRRDFIDKSKVLEENIAIATAIYLQPRIDNSLFKSNRAIEIAKEVEEMPIHLIYPIGFFLLMRAQGFGQMPTSGSLLTLNNLRQTLKGMLPHWLRFRR